MNFIVVLTLVAAASAAPQAQTEPVPILKYDSEIDPAGSYGFSFETGNGISVEEKSSLKNIGAEEPALEVQGRYRYTWQGRDFEVSYTADEYGFRPRGDSIPTPPPIPPAIQRALEYNLANRRSEDEESRSR